MRANTGHRAQDTAQSARALALAGALALLAPLDALCLGKDLPGGNAPWFSAATGLLAGAPVLQVRAAWHQWWTNERRAHSHAHDE